MLLPPFAVLRDGEPIQDVRLRTSVRTGIDFNDVRIELGMIPELEEREAAVYVHVPWSEWLELPIEERAAAVAQHRLHNLISVHVEDAVARETERRAKQKQ